MFRTILPAALLCGGIGLAASVPSSLAAAPEPAAAKAERPGDATRARALLERAAAHLRANGDQALVAFSRVGEFTDGELYVYVLDGRGMMLASGGGTFTLIGRNLADYEDPDGKRFIAEMLVGARSVGSGSVEYRWLNMQRGRVEKKVVHYQAVGERIVAVGHYLPRGTADQARAFLFRAVDEVKRLGPEAFVRFNDLNGGFMRDDTYVFVVGLDDGLMHANGAMPRLVGRNVGDLTDAAGKPFVRDMVSIAKRKGAGELDYRWRNPATGAIENKRAYLQRVGNYLVGVGYYESKQDGQR